MNRTVLSVDAKAKAPPERLHLRHLKRIVLMACRYRSKLITGLLATVIFACLHTVTIGGAFPIFKLLLEEEGLQGWIQRTVASQRLGANLTAVTDEHSTRVLHLSDDSPLNALGIEPGDELSDSQGRLAAELFAELAKVGEGVEFSLLIASAGSDDETALRRVMVTPASTDWSSRQLLWAAQIIPADADQQKLQLLTWILAGMVMVVVLANLCRYVGEVFIAESVLRAMLQLRCQLYDRTLQLPLSFFAGQATSDLVGRFVQDMQEIQRGLLTLFSKFIREPLRVVFIVSLALWLDWRITLTLVSVTPPLLLLFWRVGKSVKKSNRKLLIAYGEMIGTLTTSLQNLRVVKAYTAEETEKKRLLSVDERVLKQQLKLARLQAFVSPMMETVAVIVVSFLTVWLASRVLNHELSTSKFGTLGIALAVLFDPVRKLTDVYVRLMRSTAGAERIFQVIDEPTETELSPADETLSPLSNSIEFNDVTFTYPGAKKPALQNVDLTIKQGETLAIVGPNGSGKTTLVSMLPRFFEPDSGTILFDGVDIGRASLASLRGQIGLVTQDSVVFAGTPTENIAYGQSDHNPQRIKEAAKRASADEFIQAIPGGYESVIGEAGQTLSGGQRQRLTIARAIFRDAPILIFDEATSQIDSESEMKIQNALQAFSKGRTTLIIAHRLSTIQFASRIVVMDEGRVIDTGAHKELFERCEVYRSLCETQFLTAETTRV